MAMTAAVMRKTFEQAEKASDPSNAEKIVLEKGMQIFILRALRYGLE
jgi:hypothetical protein